MRIIAYGDTYRALHPLICLLEPMRAGEQTSRTMEYAYDDYVFGQLAKALGYDSIADILMQRAQNYRNIINPMTKWADGRNDDGTFINSDPWSFQKFICEGQPCHYTWYVPHDIPGLIDAMGGEQVFISKLDSVFESGHYWHGNEPCHQIAYLYNYTSPPWKTQLRVQEILKSQYAATPDGLSGNDDAGQMSAWYIFSSLGFYPICPGIPEYALGIPSFKKAVIHLTSGKDFTIINNTEGGKTKEISLNGQSLNRYFITHEDIINGGVLIFK